MSVPRPAPAAAEESGRAAGRRLGLLTDLVALARPLHAAKSVLLVPVALLGLIVLVWGAWLGLELFARMLCVDCVR